MSLIFYYIYCCLRQWVIPWHYFQLNSGYFNAKKGIFSKLDIDKCIPKRFRLLQYPFDPKRVPDVYPVFLKPEWGQNSKGIIRANDKREYLDFGEIAQRGETPYIVQEVANGANEYEIYYLRSAHEQTQYAYLSITEVENKCSEAHPINSIHNPSTTYRDITGSFTEDELEKIWQLVGTIGRFRMARVGVKADNFEALVQGKYKIIEINLFLPLPLVLLSHNVQRKEKLRIIRKTMIIAAQLVGTLSQEETRQWIFFRKMRAHYKIAP